MLTAADVPTTPDPQVGETYACVGRITADKYPRGISTRIVVAPVRLDSIEEGGWLIVTALAPVSRPPWPAKHLDGSPCRSADEGEQLAVHTLGPLWAEVSPVIERRRGQDAQRHQAYRRIVEALGCVREDDEGIRVPTAHLLDLLDQRDDLREQLDRALARVDELEEAGALGQMARDEALIAGRTA